jgi:DNA-binding transcriptional MerR regulator
MSNRSETGGPGLLAAEESLGIGQVAVMSGLSQDTLRWYEREGLLPRMQRGTDRRRQYTSSDAALVVMLAKLRDSGMPTEDMREFSRLVAGGPATHGRRLALLERHRSRIRRRMTELQDSLAALEAKTQHYRDLIDAGLDCAGRTVSPDIAALQRATDELGPS